MSLAEIVHATDMIKGENPLNEEEDETATNTHIGPLYCMPESDWNRLIRKSAKVFSVLFLVDYPVRILNGFDEVGDKVSKCHSPHTIFKICKIEKDST